MKKNVIVTIMIVIIFVLGIALGGVCMYLYNANTDKNDICQMSNNTVNTNNGLANINNNQLSNNTAIIDSNSINNTISNTQQNAVSENSYKLYQQNYNKIFDGSINKDSSDVEEQYYNPVVYRLNAEDPLGIFSAEIDSKGDAYIDIANTSNLHSKYGDTYKVASNVADLAFCGYDSGGHYYLALINQDGTVSIIMAGGLEREISEIIVTNIPNVNNAVKIIYGFGEYYYRGAVVDINGNVIGLEKYVDKIYQTTQYPTKKYLDSYYNARN